MVTQKIVHHHRKTRQIKNANLIEYLGIRAMAFGAILTKPLGYVGYSLIAKTIGFFLPSKTLIATTLHDSAVFAYPYADPYWSRLVYNKDTYAEDVEQFLRSLNKIDYAFIDCGANFGFMSVIVTSPDYGEKPAIAIEADPGTFQYLEKNLALNNNRFDIRHNAIYSSSGQTVNIYGEKHEARSILPETETDTSHGNVETLVPDDLLDWLASKNTTASILKLDVEGVEIDALKGAEKLLETDCMVYYEDHGADRDHEISRYIKDTLGLKIFAPDEHGACHEITNLDQLSAIKTNRRVGYDFVATKSEMWLNEISKLKS